MHLLSENPMRFSDNGILEVQNGFETTMALAEWSGKEALRCRLPPPLRTGRESFPSSGAFELGGTIKRQGQKLNRKSTRYAIRPARELLSDDVSPTVLQQRLHVRLEIPPLLAGILPQLEPLNLILPGTGSSCHSSARRLMMSTETLTFAAAALRLSQMFIRQPLFPHMPGKPACHLKHAEPVSCH